MNHKTVVRMALCALVALLLVVNATVAAASPSEQGNHGEKVFTVKPNGKDDTANLQQAFAAAKAAGPGSTVQLAAGKFRIGLMEVWDFKGYFKGAGQGKTVIDTFSDQNCQALLDQNKWPALVYFVRGYPRISDLSFQITPSAPCKPYNMGGYGPDWRSSSIFPLVVATPPWNNEADCAQVRNEQVSALIERVTITGAEGTRTNGEADLIWPNIWEAAYLGGMYAMNTPFQYAQIGLTTAFLSNSRIQVGGSPKDGNTFDKIAYIGYLHDDGSNSNFEFSNNRMDHIYETAVYLVQGAMALKPSLPHASNFTYLNNEITVLANRQDLWGGVGFFLLDVDNLGMPNSPYPSTGSRAKVVVKNNTLNLQPGICGIWMEGLNDAQIIDNKISGSGDLAIKAGKWGPPTQRALIKGNNLNKFTPTSGLYKILLAWGTEKYVVVGESGELVQDLGTDNLITGNGRHNHDQQPDQALQGAMNQKAQMHSSPVR
jgi:hypothetical protein